MLRTQGWLKARVWMAGCSTGLCLEGDQAELKLGHKSQSSGTVDIAVCSSGDLIICQVTVGPLHFNVRCSSFYMAP